jgi:hypothetical protein
MWNPADFVTALIELIVGFLLQPLADLVTDFLSAIFGLGNSGPLA